MSLLHPKRERGLVHHVAPFAFFVFLAATVVERLDVGCSLWLQSTMTALTATQTYTLDLYNIIYPGSCGRAEQACLYYVHTPFISNVLRCSHWLTQLGAVQHTVTSDPPCAGEGVLRRFVELTSSTALLTALSWLVATFQRHSPWRSLTNSQDNEAGSLFT